MKIKMEIPVTNWKILIREGNYKNRLERNIKISTFPELFLLYMATFTTLLARELKEVSFNALKCEVEGSVIYNVRDQNRRLGESLMSNAVWDGAGGAGWCHAPGGPWTITRDTEDTNMKILRVISERWLWWYEAGGDGRQVQMVPEGDHWSSTDLVWHVSFPRTDICRGCLLKSQTRCERILKICLC